MSKPFSVYVAGPTDELERCRAIHDRLKRCGITATSAWVAAVDAHGGIGNPRDMTPADRRVLALTNKTGIVDATVFWFLTPAEAHGRGGYFEAGIAHQIGKKLIFSGVDTKQSVFCALGEEFDNDEEALDRVIALALAAANPIDYSEMKSFT